MDNIVVALRKIGSWISVPLFLFGAIALLGDTSSLVLCARLPTPQSWQRAQEFWSSLPVDFVLLIGGWHLFWWPARVTPSSSTRPATGESECVTVRMRLRAAFWPTFTVLILYPLSTGPAVWLLWNVRLPEWSVVGFHGFYLPLKWLALKSEAYFTGLSWYNNLWFDLTKPQATPSIAFPYGDTPPFLSAFSGILISAWLVLSLVRWLNRRDMTRLGIPPAATHDSEPASH